jgi:8-oxo-dGTP pyrophosphatase MutT (NUDIX family)
MEDVLRWKAAPFEIVYAREPFPTAVKKTIFLAGPTPRKDGDEGWRNEALGILREMGYDGHVFVPEPRDGKWLDNYETQIEWEEEGLNRADVIAFWVPRSFPTMMALTTNIEWGEWKGSGKAVWGAPDEAVNVRYPTYYAKKLGIPVERTLRNTLLMAIDRLGDGAPREGGECQVPLHIWKRKEFELWLKSQKSAGNRLEGARVVWGFFPKPRYLFCYAIHVNVFVAAENRYKSNEIIIARPDVSATLLYRLAPNLWDTKVVLVREFRSTARNEESFVYELPGGSSVDELSNPLGVAAEEVKEELGLELDYTRFDRHETRQINATFSIHRCTLFTCELTSDEIQKLEADSGPHGNHVTDSEMTYVAIKTLKEIASEQLVDWAQLGMIFSVLKT